MLHQHIDVDIPLCLQSRRGELLSEFEEFTKKLCYQTWRVSKATGNHLTGWWLYVRLNNHAPSKSQVQYGATAFEDVNPVPHLWSRAKEAYRRDAHNILREFMQMMVVKTTLLPPPCPARPVPRPIALADFDGTEFGPEYLTFVKGDVILPKLVLGNVSAEGWAHGQTSDGNTGWYPPEFVVTH